MKRFLRGLRVLVSLLLFGAALWILRDVVREYDVREIVVDLRSIAPLRIVASLCLTAVAYLALVGYDVVALRYLGRRLDFRRILPVSFIAFAVSNSAPVSLLTGGGLRARLYAGLGLTSADIAGLIAFDVVTYVVGLFVTGGIVFLFEPLAIPGSLHLHSATVHPLGVLFLVLAGGYLLVSIVRRRPIAIGSREIRLPRPQVAFGQAGVSVLDWTLSCAALYVLLPGDLPASYLRFLGIFLLAQIAALISPLPGGLGVFEGLILLLLPAGSPVPGVVGSLLVYRVTYYLLPLLAAAALIAVRAIQRRLARR